MNSGAVGLGGAAAQNGGTHPPHVRVLVTGGAGFIGSHVVRRLLGLGHRVAVLDQLRQYCVPLTPTEHLTLADRFAALKLGCEVIEGDAADPGVMASVMAAFRPTHVVHLAGVPLLSYANEHPEEAYESMIGSTATLLAAFRRASDIARLVFVSSSTVYGNFVTEPATEEHPLVPKDVYGGAKLAGEVMVQSFARRFGLPCAIVRPSAVYGPGDINRRVTQMFVENALAGRPLVLKDPAARLDFTFVEDAAEGIVLALLHPDAAGGVFNITRGEGCSLLDVVRILQRWVPDLAIRCEPADGLAPRRGSLSIDRAREVMGYQPRYRLEQGLARCVEAAMRRRADAGLGPAATLLRQHA